MVSTADSKSASLCSNQSGATMKNINDKIREYYLNNKDQLQSSANFLLILIREYINIVEELELTNEQWFIDWEDKMNRLTVEDHNKQPTQ